jgi:hypothetical protein
MKVQAQEQGKPALRNIAKMLMNSLYGRFGMHPHTNKVLLADPAQAKLIASAFPGSLLLVRSLSLMVMS